MFGTDVCLYMLIILNVEDYWNLKYGIAIRKSLVLTEDCEILRLKVMINRRYQ